jgi:hypothetical protein
MDKSYPVGVDVVWLGADRDGFVAAFVTAGVGPIPSVILSENFVPIEEVEERISELPRVSIAEALVNVKRPDDFLEIAKRGIFVYDWRDAHRTAANETGAYEAVAKPLTPTTIDELSRALKTLAKRIVFDQVHFADLKPIKVGEQLPEILMAQ